MPPSADRPRSEGRPDEPIDAGFEREADLLRSLAAEPAEPLDAPPEVWAGIEAALAEDADRPKLIRPGELAAGPLAQPEAPVVLADRRRRPGRWLAAAAAVVLVVAAGVLVAVNRDDGTTELAATELRPLNGIDVGSAHAEVRLERRDGELRLQVAMEDLPLPAEGTFYEMWLLADDGEPVSVAAMKDPEPTVRTEVQVPGEIDTDRYRVVDVSIQQIGAGPEHSGESILRGRLTA